MRHTSKTTHPSYTAQRRWMEHARSACVKRYGDRVLLCDGFMLTFIPYGALPETLLASETEARLWGSETRSPADPDSVLADIAQDAQVYLSRQLDCLNTVTDTYHLLTDADGNPVASVSADLIALALAVPFDDTVTWRAHVGPELDKGCTVSAWQGERLMGVFMSVFTSGAKTAFVVRRTPAGTHAQSALGADCADWDAVERAKGALLANDLLRMFALGTPGARATLVAIVERQRAVTYPSGFSAALADTLVAAIGLEV